MLVNVYDAGPALIQRLVFAGYIYNEKGVLLILVIQNIFFITSPILLQILALI